MDAGQIVEYGTSRQTADGIQVTWQKKKSAGNLAGHSQPAGLSRKV